MKSNWRETVDEILEKLRKQQSIVKPTGGTTGWKCLWCGKRLYRAPTNIFWIDHPIHSGICYECVLGLTKLVVAALTVEEKI